MFMSTMDISSSALVAQRTNLDTIAGNIANMQATRDENGDANPYRRRIALFAHGARGSGRGAAGVRVDSIVESDDAFRLVHDPSHPDAIKQGEQAGYVRYPNVDYSTEMVNGMMAARIYEANVTVMEITKTMMAASLRVMA
ncbi:MAG: flagellar basal body rod protein FlgC [Planctomycetes bacterium]|nr:flagellar basal body rod protein FlgC [Planctomycetota bacterium]